MPSTDPVSRDAWGCSLRRSRSRRAAALRTARRRFRSRGSIASLVTLLATGAFAADLAAGQPAGVEPAPGAVASGYVDKGDVGAQIVGVQQALGVPADGVFGPDTQAAVQGFQQRNGLLADGIAGPETLAALGLASPATSAPEQAASEQARPAAGGGRSATGDSGSGGSASGGESAPGRDGSASGGGSGSTPGGASASGSAPAGVLQEIAQCESGGDPSAVSAGGEHRGKYQFSQETWEGLGGSGDPAEASEAEQDQRAQQLLDQSGTDPWAGCL